jgi:hypothetical protein
MTAKQKTQVLRHWTKFLKGGFKREDFTKQLYHYLEQHAGFIAHYDIEGFYGTYFKAQHNIGDFFAQFFDYRKNCYRHPDYTDINDEMVRVYETAKPSIDKLVVDDYVEKLETLESWVKKAKTDKEFAIQLVKRVF